MCQHAGYMAISNTSVSASFWKIVFCDHCFSKTNAKENSKRKNILKLHFCIYFEFVTEHLFSTANSLSICSLHTYGCRRGHVRKAIKGIQNRRRGIVDNPIHVPHFKYFKWAHPPCSFECFFLFLLFVSSIINKCKVGDLRQIYSAIVPEARSLIQRCQ